MQQTNRDLLDASRPRSRNSGCPFLLPQLSQPSPVVAHIFLFKVRGAFDKHTSPTIVLAGPPFVDLALTTRAE